MQTANKIPDKVFAFIANQRNVKTIWKILVVQTCPTVCKHMNCSLPSGHGILQTRILEWVAIPFSSRSSQPRDWTWDSCITGSFFTVWATRETLKIVQGYGKSGTVMLVTTFEHSWVPFNEIEYVNAYDPRTPLPGTYVYL